MKIQLIGKNALVGASTGGIGYGVATVLAECGANVTLMARNEANLKKLSNFYLLYMKINPTVICWSIF